MSAETYHQLIREGLEGLPDELLAEIADFVFFVRKRALQPEAFQEEMQAALLVTELRQWSRDETAHLEEEFQGYEERYPQE